MTSYFYKPNEKLGALSNFYLLSSPLKFQGKEYRTTEHLYQALKFLGPGASEASKAFAEAIRMVKTPMMSKVLARMKITDGYAWRIPLNAQIKTAIDGGVAVRADWDDVKLEKMKMILMLKFTQNEQCKQILLSTGENRLAEHTAIDLFWGDGGDNPKRMGLNHLGNLLMEVRELIREQDIQAGKRRLFGIVDAKKARVGGADEE